MTLVQEYADYQRRMKEMGFHQTQIDKNFIESAYARAISLGFTEAEAEEFATNCAEAIRRFHSAKFKIYFVIGMVAVAAAVVLVLT